MYVPSAAPGFSPICLNWLMRYSDVRSSPRPPGARPSKSSDASAVMWASTAAESTSGISASARRLGASATGALLQETHDADEPKSKAKSQLVALLFITVIPTGVLQYCKQWTINT